MDDQGNWTQKQQNAYKSVLPLFSSLKDEEPTIRSLTAINEGNENEDEKSLHVSPDPLSPAKKDESNSPNKKPNKRRKQSIMGTLG
jgi:hypothetical protein